MSKRLLSKPPRPAHPLSQVHLPPGSAEEAIASIRAYGSSFPQAAGFQAAQKSTSLQIPAVPVSGQSQQPQTGAPLSEKAKGKQPEKAQEQSSASQIPVPQASQQAQQPQTEAPLSEKAKGKQPNKSLKRSIDSVEPSTSQEGPPLKKPVPADWWEAPGFSEAFKQFHRDRYRGKRTFALGLTKGIVDLAILEHKKIQAAAAAHQAAADQVVANPAVLEQDTATITADLQALENLPGDLSSDMGTDNQQTALSPPIDPQLQEQYVDSSMDPRAHAMFVGGVKLSQVGLGPDSTLPKDDVDSRFKLIKTELKNQASRVPIPPASALPRQPPKAFVGGTYQIPTGVEDPRLKEVLRRRNEIILNTQKQVDLDRNNLAAKGTRERREEKEKNLKKIISRLQVEMNWWRLKAVSLGGNTREWDGIPDSLKNKMLQDMDEKVCKAELAQSAETKKIKGLEHSARNTENARLLKEDGAKKEKMVQAIIAAIEAKDREFQDAKSQGIETPEMNLDEFVEMTVPDDEIPVDTTTAPGVTTWDTAEAPTPIDGNLNNSIYVNTGVSDININNCGVPIETTTNIGENADAGGAIGHVNTTDVNNAMDETAMDTDNMVGTFDMSDGSLPPNNWGYQENGQIDNLPVMSMDFQGAPLNNYGLQDNGMQNNYLPDGNLIDNGLHNNVFNGFDPQNTNFPNLESQGNGFMQNGPQDSSFTINDIQNTDFSNNGLQANSFTTNSFQRIDFLDNGIQGNASFDNVIQDNGPFDNGIQGNASFDNAILDNASISTGPQGNGNATNKRKPYRVTKTSKTSNANKSNGRTIKKPENIRGEITGADIPRVENHNPINPIVLANARLDHIDSRDPYAFGGRPPSASQQIITPRASDFANDKYLTYENSFTSAGNQSLFTSEYEMVPSDPHSHELLATDYPQSHSNYNNTFVEPFDTQSSSYRSSQAGAHNGSTYSYAATNDTDFRGSYTDLLQDSE